jgi:hypothetical protein
MYNNTRNVYDFAGRLVQFSVLFLILGVVPMVSALFLPYEQGVVWAWVGIGLAGLGLGVLMAAIGVQKYIEHLTLLDTINSTRNHSKESIDGTNNHHPQPGAGVHAEDGTPPLPDLDVPVRATSGVVVPFSRGSGSSPGDPV